MRLALLGFLLALCSLSNVGRADQLFGDCSSATPVNQGAQGGYTCSDEFHDGFQEFWTYSRWHRIVLSAGQSVTARVQPTSGYQVGQVFANLYDSCPGGATVGTALPATTATPFENPGVAVTNTTMANKTYWMQVYMWAVGSYGYMTYSVNAQFTISVPFVNYCAAAANSTGVAAVLNGVGSVSIATNNMRFDAANLPATTMGLLACGQLQSQAPFGDGVLCIAGNVTRLRVAPGSTTGTWTVPVDFPSLPPGVITAGSQRYFQLYYRDSAGPLGTGFNLTNGVAVSFTP